MQTRKARFLSTTLVCIVLVILYDQFPLFALTPDQFWRMKVNELEGHKLWWAARGVSKYQMGVHFKRSMLSYPGLTSLDCSEEMVVDHKTVVQTIRSNCGSAASLTVEALFSLIEEKVKSKHCDPEGCHCGPLVIDVVYDLQYSFPKTAKTFYDLQLGWLFMQSGKSPLVCMGMGGNDTEGITVEIDYFLPLQSGS